MITEAIDLTLECDFAGDYNQALLPNKYRQFNDFDIRDDFRRILSPVFNVFFLEVFPMDELYCDTYIDLFDVPPKSSRGFTDPWFAYHFCSGYTCDCCGIELNMFNRGKYRTMCDFCEDKMEDEHEKFEL